MLVANYTRSKALDNGSGIYNFSQPSGLNVGQYPQQFLGLNKGLSEFDRPNDFTAAALYRTRGNRWTRGFEIDTMIVAHDGLPLYIGQTNANPAQSGTNQQRPNECESRDEPLCAANGERNRRAISAARRCGEFSAAAHGTFIYRLLCGAHAGVGGRNRQPKPRCGSGSGSDRFQSGDRALVPTAGAAAFYDSRGGAIFKRNQSHEFSGARVELDVDHEFLGPADLEFSDVRVDHEAANQARFLQMAAHSSIFETGRRQAVTRKW